ncbi:CvpA family protein [Kineococcus rhizosphaerae]|uniref:Colicin V production protein n=1 Tax=Kineococcus rhizosphaerae TaxID=559628 RepID=A0A2T0QYC9_9ACTN|nr:CvpA family protein [Kineococcus rhizosphaerae]PRY11184.1 colicin V production protein [Kineococcus rhizosphaerae]
MDISSLTPHLPGGLRPAGLLVLALAVLVVVLAARSGWRRGASRPVLALLGLAAGAVTGLTVAGRVEDRWPQTGWDALALTAGTVVVLAVVGAGLGGALGSALSRALGAVHLRVVDRAAGAVLRGGLAVLVLALVLPLLPGNPAGGLTGPGGFGGAGLDRARQVVAQAADEIVGRGAGRLADAAPTR